MPTHKTILGAAERVEADARYRRVDPAILLRAVVREGMNRERWHSTTQFAIECLVREPRKVRTWISRDVGETDDMPPVVLEKLIKYAVEFEIDQEALTGSSAPSPERAD